MKGDNVLQNSFGIDTHRDGDVVFVHFSGEFDVTCIEAFKDEMELVKQSDPSEVVLDLQRLRFMDSTGIRMILAAQAEYETLSIVPGPPNVMRVLEVAGVDTRLSYFSEEGRSSAADAT